jgi:two-component sensor histidine kinase
LSAEAGTLDVSCAPPDNEVVIVWTERGGPPVSAPEGVGGFGSKLVTRSMSQLGGSIERQWQEEGVVVTMTISKDRLSR